MENRRNQDHDQDRNWNNFSSNGYSSHHHHHDHDHDHVHLQTSCNNGGVLVLHDSRNNHQFPANRSIILNPPAGGPIGLRLMKSPYLIKELKFLLNKEKEVERDEEQFAYAVKKKLKATNMPAVFLKIGSWKWVSKNEGDLVAKFYYGRKKLIWEFLYGSLKKKIEIRWSQISAIKAFLGQQDKGVLRIQLNEPPEFGQEVRFQAGKHTLWGPSPDFTEDQARVFRRHTVEFLPGVLNEAFEKLLQCDSRLFNISRQPFPANDSPLFCNQILDFSNNRSVVQGSSSVPNLVQPSSSFVHRFNSNLRMPDMKIPNSDELRMGVPSKKQRIDGILEQDGNRTQVQESSFHPIGDHQDPILQTHGKESSIPDQELQVLLANIKDLEEVTKSLSWISDIPLPELHITDTESHNPNDQFSNDQINFETCGNGIIDGDQSHVNGEFEDSSWNTMETRIDGSSSGGGVTNHTDNDFCHVDHESRFNSGFAYMESTSLPPSRLYIQDFSNGGNGGNGMEYRDNRNLHSDNDFCHVDRDSGFNGGFAYMESTSLPPSQLCVQDFSNGGNGMEYRDNRNLHSFDPSGGNGELASGNPNHGAN